MVSDKDKEKKEEEGEEKFSAKSSRKAYFFVYAMIVVLIASVFLIRFYGGTINNTAMTLIWAFVIISIAFTEIHRMSTFYEINNSSLISVRGILSRKERRVDLTAISDADSDQTTWQRILGYGDVSVRLFSKDSSLSIKNINNPHQFVDVLEKHINKKRGEKGK